MSSNQDPLIEGYLEKQGEGGLKMYKKRFFRFIGNNLYYYIDKNSSKSLGYIDIRNARSIKKDPKSKLTFIIDDPSKRPFRLKAENEKELDNWLDILTKFNSNQRETSSSEREFSIKLTETILDLNDSQENDDLIHIDFDQYKDIDQLKALVIEKEKERIKHENLIFELTKRISEISQSGHSSNIDKDKSREMVTQMSKDINDLYEINNNLRHELDQLKQNYEIASNENIIMKDHIKELEMENKQLSILKEEIKVTKLEKQYLIDKLERLESLNLSEISIQNDTLIKKNESLNRKMDQLKDEIDNYEKQAKATNKLKKENERMRAYISTLQESSKNSLYLTTEINSLRQEVQELKISNHSLENLKEKLSSNINQLHSEIITYSKESADLKHKLEQLENVNRDYKRINELTNGNKSSNHRQLFDDLSNKIQAELNSLNELSKESNMEESKLSKTIMTEYRIYYSKIKEYEDKIKVYKEKEKANDESIRQYESKIKEQEDEISRSNSLIQQLESDKETYKLRNSELESKVNELENDIKSVKESYEIRNKEHSEEVNQLKYLVNQLESEVSSYKSKYEDTMIKSKAIEDELISLKESISNEQSAMTNSIIERLESENKSIKLKNDELIKNNADLLSEIVQLKDSYEKKISLLEQVNKEAENKIKSAIIFPENLFKDDPNSEDKSKQIEIILRRKIEEFSFAYDDNIKLREMNRILFERNKYLEHVSKKFEEEISQKNETLTRLSVQVSNLKQDNTNIPERIKSLLSELENSKVASQALQTHISYLERKIDELIEDKSIEVAARKDRLETYRKDIVKERNDLIDLLCVIFHGKEREKVLEFLNEFDSLKRSLIEEIIENIKSSKKYQNVNINIENMFEKCKTMNINDIKNWIIQNIES